ncbi:MAG: HAD family phosphatase [Prevotella sp.]|nr:HAD family phosphatase [Prevotella sp.]
MEIALRAALFDLDGVVFDTESQYSIFWGGQCRKYHPDRPGLEREIKGQTLVQIFDRYFSGMEREQTEIVRELNEFEQRMTFGYIGGFVQFIKSLRENGVRTAIVTSSNKMKMDAVYAVRPELNDLFDAILTSEDFARSKPDPDCYEKGAEKFHLPNEQCIVFEDSFNGLKAGRAAGMKVVGIATTNPADAIWPYSDYVIADFSGLDYRKLCGILGME